MSRPAHRRVSRVILLDPEDRFLLLKTHSPNLLVPRTRWITPGGGVEDHESHAEGAIRELFEETGMLIESVGDPIWAISSESVFNDGHVQTTYSEFFVVHTDNFQPVNDNWMANEFVDISDIRWWTKPELASSGEKYSPVPLFELIDKAISLR